MKLKRREYCPIHRAFNCCGRGESPSRTVEQKPKYGFVGGVKRIPDEFHIRGYREVRTPAEMRKLTARKIREQNRMCGLCGLEFTDMREVVPDHIIPRGMNGGRRDDHAENIQASHSLCNSEKGSMSMDQWRAYRKEKGLPCG